MSEDMVNHPPHYNNHPSGIECNEVREHILNSNLSDAYKYCWREGDKDESVQELRKAIWYLNSEFNRLLNYPSQVMPVLPQDVEAKHHRICEFEEDQCLHHIMLAYIYGSMESCSRALVTVGDRLDKLNG